MPKLSKKLLARISKVTNKRARLVLDTIAQKGSVTTEDLKRAGYDHPPRAARDVRELGFSLKTTWVKNSTGRRIGAYTLGDQNSVPAKEGRSALPKAIRAEILKQAGGKCQICGSQTNIQVDHRVPFEVAGEGQGNKRTVFQVLCGACNRKKSWSCEHCENWKVIKSAQTCLTCYWADPQNYSHVAMLPERRHELVWTGEEVAAYERLRGEAISLGETVGAVLKRKLSE